MTEERYLVKFAKGLGGDRDLDRLPKVIHDCPMNYRLHSITPQAAGAGYTDFYYVVFELTR